MSEKASAAAIPQESTLTKIKKFATKNSMTIALIAVFILFYFLTGFISTVMLLIMSLAMQYGPNGTIWSIVQSGTV